MANVLKNLSSRPGPGHDNMNLGQQNHREKDNTITIEGISFEKDSRQPRSVADTRRST